MFNNLGRDTNTPTGLRLLRMFKDRTDAGIKLAKQLVQYEGKNTIVLAIPRGGVLVGFEVAKKLHAKFSVIIVRKLPFPNNPDEAFGSIAEDDSLVLLRGASTNISPGNIELIADEQRKEIQRQIDILRGGRPLLNIENSILILIDDGAYIRSPMQASIQLCSHLNPQKLIVASPVGSPEVARAYAHQDNVDDTIILEQPKFFRSVNQIYETFNEVTDYEVLTILNQW
jgi:putative phosphoribosyl transferase